MNYKKGDVINPAEPPVGTVLQSDGPLGAFRIRHHHDGWKLTSKNGRTKVCWRTVLSQWGPGAGQTLTVVKVP